MYDAYMFKLEHVLLIKEGERVRALTKPHALTLVPGLTLALFLIVSPFFFLFPLFREGWVGVLIFLGLLGSATYFFSRAYVRWSNTVMIVTDRRVIDVERKAFFDREISEISYPRIDEVSYRVKGLFPTLFRYGSIRLHVAGTAADIEFKNAARPSRIHDLINDLREHSRATEKTNGTKVPGKLELHRDFSPVPAGERDEAIEKFFDDSHA